MKFVTELITNKEIRNKILFTIFILIVFRVLANVPLPGIDMNVYQSQFADRSTSEANYLLSIFTGGLLDTPSIVGLGIGVYITASIIIQLLSSIIPRLEELSKEGARGKQVLDQYTRLLTLPLSLAYSTGYLVLLSQQTFGFNETGEPLYLIPRPAGENVSVLKILFMAMVLSVGSLIVMWLAELITENGIANGSSIMIMVGILSTLPALVQNDIQGLNLENPIQRILKGEIAALRDPSIIALAIIVFGLLLLTALVIYITESTRRIPIQYAQRQRSGAVQESFLPLKLNQTGVMPIIFASSLLTIPQLIVPLLTRVVNPDSPVGKFVSNLSTSFIFDRNSLGYSIAYLVFIFMFSIFYVFIQFKPDQVAEDLQKRGGFVPTVRPGKSTEEYLSRVIVRLTVVGSIFLGFIALIPIVAGNAMLRLVDVNFAVFSAIGGTSILIVIGVILEASRQATALRASHNYEKYS